MASSSSNPRWTRDVFLSFRGEDTRYGFTGHLYADLVRRGFNTFIDNNLRRGEEIAPELLKAIQESKSSIVVFSKNYAGSRWCLNELAKIMECRQEIGQLVFPIFYHVDPSEVRKQSGSFGEAFTNYEENWKDKVPKWRKALTEAGNLSGWHLSPQECESQLINKITTQIASRILNYKFLFDENDLVGMDSRLKKLSLKLSTESNDVRMIGICGTGGIGKTTIAQYVYNQISWKFECSSFLANVGKANNDEGILDLQNQLLSDILEEGNQNIRIIRHGANVIKYCLSLRRALIVLDDVDNMKQLEYLAGNHNWFGGGNRIIITTRNKQLIAHKVDYIYDVETLNFEEALELFSRYAFKQNLPQEDYENLSYLAIDYCQGLPLALKVLGSLLCGKTIHVWESELNKLKKEPMGEVQNVLRRSFDGLDPTQRKIFLDIACFFEGEDRDFVSKILDGCDLYGESGISVLCDRCLISISYNRIYMHGLIQQMGWLIVREKYPKNPSKWSRLWNHDDIYRAFTSEKGMNNVESISLDLSRSTKIWFTPKIFDQMKKVFAKMKKLRLLKVYYRYGNEYKMLLPKDFKFPPDLRYLHWEGLESLPLNFHGENLVAINLKSSNIKELWKGDKCFAELKFIDLSKSQRLMKIPKFSSMPKLERLNLDGCTSFCNLHLSIGEFPKVKFLRELNFRGSGIKELSSSIGSLPSLEILDLSECSNFEKFPDIFANMGHLRKLNLRLTRIKELPSSIGYLESLENLNISACINFEKFPEIQGNMKFLKELTLSSTAIKELPSSIGSLPSLEILNLSGCLSFEKFPDIFANMGHLRKLHLSLTGIKELPNSIGYLESLEVLNISHCLNVEKFPEIQGNMKCLKDLRLDNTAIKELPNSIGSLEALEYLVVGGCSSFEKLPDILKNMGNLRVLSVRETAIKELPCSIGHLTRLERLNLENCKNLSGLPSSIFWFKYLQELSLHSCSNVKAFPEIMVDMEYFHSLRLHGVGITELPSSIERLKVLQFLELSNCENLVTLPNSIGNLTCLGTLRVHNCSKLQKLPDNLRSLQCCLRELDLAGCNLMEGAIPGDLWRLSSLESLDVSKNRIGCIPAGIIQLSKLRELDMNHCPMLEEIPELPSSLGRIGAHGCPCLESLSSPTHVLWSSLLNSFKLKIENCRRYGNSSGFDSIIHIIIPGSIGIPEWIKDKSMGSQIRIELPKNWYKDDNFLGFALFFHHLPLDDDEECMRTYNYSSHEFGSIRVSSRIMSCGTYDICVTLEAYRSYCSCAYDEGGTSDPALEVFYFPQIQMSSHPGFRQWKNIKARFNGSYECGYKRAFKVKSCGIHLIYAQAQNHHKKKINTRSLSRGDPHHKRSRHV